MTTQLTTNMTLYKDTSLELQETSKLILRKGSRNQGKRNGLNRSLDFYNRSLDTGASTHAAPLIGRRPRNRLHMDLNRSLPKMISQKKQPKSRYSKELRGFSVALSPEMQSKVDYFITPYNKELHCHRFMDFSKQAERRSTHTATPQVSQENWSKLMNFITKHEKVSFRQSLSSINDRLYKELNKFMGKEKITEDTTPKELEKI